VRDLVGHGEGIFGIVDGYPDDVPGASWERLKAIESRCHEWRWRLRAREGRLHRIHGDFHPFNVLFDDDDRIGVLDTSRGSVGDPADDVVAMTINYVFFALERPGAWERGLGPLWHAFYREYFALRPDVELLDVAAPFLAWRALVLANPRWYPRLSERSRRSLLTLAECALEADRFDLSLAEELVR
jgi:Ser/Thr protein kinase RdoA (MazF antagonist)